MDNFKNEVFTISYDHKLGTWRAIGINHIDNGETYGETSDHWLMDDEKEIAPALALLDLLGYDIEILADKMGVIKGD